MLKIYDDVGLELVTHIINWWVVNLSTATKEIFKRKGQQKH